MNTRLAVLALVLAACDGEAPANPDGGGLDGQAGVANVATAEEISQAQREMNMRWESLIAALRNSAPDFTNIDTQSAQQIQSVAGGLRFT